MTATPDFRYWNSVDPTSFLDHDWENPSRQWATREAIEAAQGGVLLEIGPGAGVDYERYFSKAWGFDYVGWEGSKTLYDALRQRYPDGLWGNRTIADLLPVSATVVYARHVLEHQPALEPALGQLLEAATDAAVITWYRPPSWAAFFEIWEGVYCQTFARADVLKVIKAHGFKIVTSQAFISGDEAWVLKR